MKELGARVRKAAPGLVKDAVAFASMGSVAGGAHMIYAPAGWIVAGLLGVGYLYLIERGKAPPAAAAPQT